MQIRPINEQEIEVITTAIARAHVVDVKEEALRTVPIAEGSWAMQLRM
jgi:hypothetical protein